jgi:ribonuclease E
LAVVAVASAVIASIETTEAVLAETDTPAAKPTRKRRPTKASVAVAAAPEISAELELDAVTPEPAQEPALDIWVELPAVDEPKAKPAKARRSRAKAKPEAEAAVEDLAEVASIEVVAEPIRATPAPEPLPELVFEPAPAPATEATLVETPAAKPKKGWWRRG